MKDNKYYTPNSKEFYIGFRYEVFSEDWDSGDIKWNKKTFPEAPELCTTENGSPDLIECFYQKFEDPEYCRIKYLDKDDIGELGWLKKNGEYIIWQGEGYSYYCLKLKYDGGYTISELSVQDSGQIVLFSGKIKNYNELQTIMTQVGII